MSDWADSELSTDNRAQFNITGAWLASYRPNCRFSGMSINLTTAAAADIMTFGVNSVISQCRFNVTTIGTNRLLVDSSANMLVSDSVFLFAATATSPYAAIGIGGAGCSVRHCYIQGPATSGGSGVRSAIAGNASGNGVVEGCVIHRWPVDGVLLAIAANTSDISNNVIANVGGSGVNFSGVLTTAPSVIGNSITGCGAYGVTAGGSGVDVFGTNRMRNNTTANINTAAIGDRSNMGTLVTTTGSDTTDFVASTLGDWRLSRGNPVYGLGVGAGDIGGSAGGGRFPRF